MEKRDYSLLLCSFDRLKPIRQLPWNSWPSWLPYFSTTGIRGMHFSAGITYLYLLQCSCLVLGWTQSQACLGDAVLVYYSQGPCLFLLSVLEMVSQCLAYVVPSAPLTPTSVSWVFVVQTCHHVWLGSSGATELPSPWWQDPLTPPQAGILELAKSLCWCSPPQLSLRVWRLWAQKLRGTPPPTLAYAALVVEGNEKQPMWRMPLQLPFCWPKQTTGQADINETRNCGSSKQMSVSHTAGARPWLQLGVPVQAHSHLHLVVA